MVAIRKLEVSSNIIVSGLTASCRSDYLLLLFLMLNKLYIILGIRMFVVYFEDSIFIEIHHLMDKGFYCCRYFLHRYSLALGDQQHANKWKSRNDYKEKSPTNA